MEVKCPRCGAPAAVENINMSQMVALCARCVSLFALELAASKRQENSRRQTAESRNDAP